MQNSIHTCLAVVSWSSHVHSRFHLIFDVIISKPSQSLNGKPSRPQRHLRSSTWPEAETSSETLFFRYEAPTRQHEELSTPLCHSGDDKQRPHSHSAAPGITGAPPFLRLWNALRLRTFCCLRTEWFPHIITCAGSRSTFTETTASGNLLDI